ncbi:CaiB/BaiF CoA-transferase family protein [Alphaproteobacteria bacterium]|jgi:crotonobetainyl-CoA:carnitine CoA-transferase CaiB-like acyl-CoA transferase|nr:CaiB/BaiF CoA-transferase family protein [Alphaproteobacteria bacterium]
MLPLENLKVLDLSRLAAGNMVSHMFADFGADVIKIEKPGKGDDLRNWKVNGISHWWAVYSRNKRSIALNLKEEEGLNLLEELVKTADVFIENFVPGTLEKWGVGPEKLIKLNNKIIILRISGWGQTGIYKNAPGFGSLVEGMSGFASMTGEKGKGPLLPPTALADMVAGLTGFGAILMAILASKKNDLGGQVIDLSLFEPLFSIIGPWAASYQISGDTPKRMGNRSNVAAPRGIYRTKDNKYISLSASMQSMWEKLAKTIGQKELITDHRFLTNTDRLNNNDDLDDVISKFMRSSNRENLLKIFLDAGVTVGPVLDISELVEHPYILDREVLIEHEDTEFGNILMHQTFPRLSKTPGKITKSAPLVGENTDDILREIGITDLQIQQLRKQNIIS